MTFATTRSEDRHSDAHGVDEMKQAHMARTPTKPTWRALQASTTHGKHSNQASFITYHHTWSSRCDDSHPTVREERTTLHELHYTNYITPSRPTPASCGPPLPLCCGPPLPPRPVLQLLSHSAGEDEVGWRVGKGSGGEAVCSGMRRTTWVPWLRTMVALPRTHMVAAPSDSLLSPSSPLPMPFLSRMSVIL